MVDFSTVLQRADDETLQVLIDREAVQILNAIDPNYIRPKNLRKILVNIHDRTELLRHKPTRNEIFSLLRPKQAKNLLIHLGVADDDAYSSLNKLSIRKNSKKEELLFQFFGVEVTKIEEFSEQPSKKNLTPEYGLFKHQREAATKVKEIIFHGELRRVLLHMPTGSGKTRTSMNIISDYLRNTEPAVVVWLAYSEELCEQAATEFEESWGLLGNRPLDVFRFWGSQNIDIEDVKDGVVVSSLSKMYNTTNNGLYFIGQLGSKTKLVIFDEAHQSIAPTFKHVLNSLLVHSTEIGLIGLSATPGRSWNDVEEDLKLSEFYHKQKVTLDVDGYDNPVNFLVDQEYLADANYTKVKVDTDLSLTNQERDEIQNLLDIPGSVLSKLATNVQRNLVIISKLRQLIKRHKRILFFATNVDHSTLMAKVLQAIGIKAYSITSNTPNSSRKRWIEEFKSEDPSPIILCNYGVLTTGFDAPKTSAAIIARPTKSLVLYSQMVGRAIRGKKAGGNKKAEILTVIDTTLPGFSNVAEAFTNWEDVWDDN
ncbi:restriction endonuclease [Rhodohalobacter sp. SW132]|uniref:DEAD/DEAH box helicase n=1 Tax=Rhodohalobacter sp. SW132 TaxID=2293433 RepID=UPI000E288098|nr:DEAD/DEAH box helicase [Rhodohalobacter sp. SW132]REL24507.1 restriction endonuclease [Rhodohalobacter sp. SW132]